MERKQIVLTPEERVELKRFCKVGVHSVRLVNRARITGTEINFQIFGENLSIIL